MTSKVEELANMQTHQIQEDCERLRTELRCLLRKAEDRLCLLPAKNGAKTRADQRVRPKTFIASSRHTRVWHRTSVPATERRVVLGNRGTRIHLVLRATSNK